MALAVDRAKVLDQGERPVGLVPHRCDQAPRVPIEALRLRQRVQRLLLAG